MEILEAIEASLNLLRESNKQVNDYILNLSERDGGIIIAFSDYGYIRLKRYRSFFVPENWKDYVNSNELEKLCIGCIFMLSDLYDTQKIVEIINKYLEK